MANNIMYIGIGMLISYIVMSVSYADSFTMQHAQCYVYDEATQVWNRLTNVKH